MVVTTIVRLCPGAFRGGVRRFCCIEKLIVRSTGRRVNSHDAKRLADLPRIAL
jgi:hypothetical protein